MKTNEKPRWSLSLKGLLYITLILLVQLIFFGWFGHLLQQQEFIADKEYHSKQVFGHSNWLAALISSSVLGAVGYSISKDDSCLNMSKWCRERVPTEIKNLSDTLSHDPTQSQQVDTLRANWKEIEGVIDQYLSQDSGASLEQHAALLKKSEPALKELIAKLKDARHNLNYEERTRFDSTRESPTEYREKQKFTLMAGVAISILGAIFTFAQFSKGVTKRIAVLTENSIRLAQGKQLSPVIRGNDEIAQLDQTFHEMAQELTKAREQLEISQRRLLMLIDNMPVGLLVVDAGGIVEFANTAAKTLFASVDPSGSKLQELLSLPAEKAEIIFNPNNSSRHLEVGFTNTEGRTYTIEISAREIVMVDGERTLEMLQDVTERNELERLKQEFVSMVSHDLRTPLSSIALFLHLVERLPDESLPAHVKNNLQIADRNTKRLLNLVNDLLDIEKLHAGKLAMNFNYQGTGSLVEESVDSMRVLAETRKISLEIDVQEFEIVGDGQRLGQVLTNLLSNAVKFSPPEAAVKVVVKRQDDWALFEVIDAGRGVPQEHREQIFEKYKQIARADGARGTGTGLGLPICKAIVEEHGGVIGVDSADTGGSKFWFRIPIRRPLSEV